MKTVILDAKTLGDDIVFDRLERSCELTVYPSTPKELIVPRLCGAECVILNKVRLTEDILSALPSLKLICVTATGFDNIDVAYCARNSVAVCNVRGYSTDSVALITVSLALSLYCKLKSFDSYVKSGEYTKSGIQNRLTPTFNEVGGKTWGVAGYGSIGKEVARIAKALGFDVLYFRKTSDGNPDCVGLDELLRRSDIISLHVPANSETIGMISRERLQTVKNGALLINAARGAVTDEAAVADAVLSGKLGGFATDVYSTEPLPSGHPFEKLYGLDNVLLTPHMAWGAYEARVRLIDEVAQNIESFVSGGFRNRIDLN